MRDSVSQSEEIFQAVRSWEKLRWDIALVWGKSFCEQKKKTLPAKSIGLKGLERENHSRQEVMITKPIRGVMFAFLSHIRGVCAH